MSYNYAQFLQLISEDKTDSYDKIIVLNLSHNKLTELPEAVGKCRNLKYLNCECNRLTILPESIGNCSQLQNLRCCRNKLTQLPESIGNCSRLNDLYCQDNPLTQLPKSLVVLRFTVLPETLKLKNPKSMP
jgi:Leucine-rich repeat (LRR) protein